MFINKDQKRIFVDVHYEQVYKSMSLNVSPHALRSRDDTVDDSNGIYQRKLLRSTVNQMSATLIQPDINNYMIYFDMDHITSIDNYAGNDVKELFKTLSKSNKIYIYNVSSDIVNKLKQLVGAEYYRNVSEKSYFCIPKEIIDDSLSGIHELVRRSFDEKLSEMISRCCEECVEGKSPSSCVKLTKYINTKKLLEEYKDAYYLVYKLALKLDDEEILSISDQSDNEDKVLFVHTMNSTVIGAILAQLFGVDLLLVDHLGPYNKLFIDGIEKNIKPTKKYIVVTDVVCMGTELSSARTLLDIFGAIYYACATIVDIIPVGLTEPEELKIHALYEVNKEHNIIGYTINTDLEG